MKLEQDRMKWEQEQAKKAEEKEERFMSLMKDMLTMLMPAPPPVMPHLHLPVPHPVPGVPWQLQDYPPGPMMGYPAVNDHADDGEDEE